MKGFAPRAASSKPSAGSKTIRPLSVSVLMRKLSTKVRPRFSHIAAAIAVRSPADFSGKARSRFASARAWRHLGLNPPPRQPQAADLFAGDAPGG